MLNSLEGRDMEKLTDQERAEQAEREADELRSSDTLRRLGRHSAVPWRVAGLADLHRQGFMRPMPQRRKKKESPPWVACERCQDWHRRGKHTRPVRDNSR